MNQLLLFALAMLAMVTASHATSTTCIGTSSWQGQQLERELDRTHALSVAPDYEPPPGFCREQSDARYQQFLQDLIAELGSGNQGAPPIKILVIDQPSHFERRSYDEDFDAICHDCRYEPFVYVVGLDTGRKLGTFLREYLRPHQLRLEPIRDKFRSLVGEDFQVRSTGAERLSDSKLFDAIEANVQIVMRELALLLPERLQQFRKDNPRVRLLPTLTINSFGTTRDLRPIQQVRTTLQQLYISEAAIR